MGPAGPQGVQGVQGAVGPAGPAGSANINGTTNFIVKFTGATSGGNSLLFDNGTNVGLGTAAPAFPFQQLGANASRNMDVQNSNAAGAAIAAFNTAAVGAGTGAGVFGTTGQSGAGAAGVWGQNSNPAGSGTFGVNTAAAGAGVGRGVLGSTSQTGAGAAGVWAQNLNPTGTGVVALGNNGSVFTLNGGSGGAFTGTTTGLYAKSTLGGGAGVPAQAIYSENNANAVRVNYWDGALQFKINGTGTVSTVVGDGKGGKVTLHAPESPEIYFTDYGEGKLVNGKAHIDIDPLFARNVVINKKHPLRVYIQLEGDSNGVYVTNKSAAGFDVVELAGGTSDVPFQWNIVCNRADEDLGGGRISRNADARFEKARPNEASKAIAPAAVGNR
jgi:hypothetical protein